MKQKLLVPTLLLAVIGIALLSPQLGLLSKFRNTPDQTAKVKAPYFANASDRGNQLLLQAANHLEQMPSVFSKARFKSRLFGQEINGPGQILLEGQGTGKSRMEFAFTAGDETQRLLQVCDGNYFYFVRQSGDQRQTEYVDVSTLSQAQDQPDVRLLNGSLTALLRMLAKTFSFEDAVSSNLGGNEVVVLVGRWRENDLRRLLEGNSQPGFFDQPNWVYAIPEHLPHQVKLTLGTQGLLKLFPLKIEFLRMSESEENSYDSIVSLDLFETQTVENIPNEMFQVYSGPDHPKDRTAFYLERLNRLVK